VALLVVGGLVAAALVWLRFQPSGAPGGVPNVAVPSATAPQEDAPSQQDLDALRRAVEEERLARFALSEAVERIQTQLERIEPSREGSRFEGNAGRTSPAEPREAGFGDDAGGARDDAAKGADGLLLDPVKLRSAGLNTAEARRLHEIYGEMWMEWLQLRRLSERGEIEEKELTVQETEIRDRYRTELGDEAYDLMLYAGGEPNRVKITDVMAGSPAQGVGLQPGDIASRTPLARRAVV
jgi:hypothetical protein